MTTVPRATTLAPLARGSFKGLVSRMSLGIMPAECRSKRMSLRLFGTFVGVLSLQAALLGISECTPSQDQDLDGYTVDEGDCDDMDENVNPGAIESPFNTLDDDCDDTTIAVVTDIAAGDQHSLAIDSLKRVWEWGYDGATSHTNPVPVGGLSDIVAVDGGGSFSLALKSDGTVWAWGSNSSGQLGDGTTVTRDLPIQVSGLADVVALSAGGNFSAALKSDGSIWTWGDNYYGQLGDGTATARSIPGKVSEFSGACHAIAAGGYHMVALKSDGTVFGWGRNYAGQVGDGGWTDQHSPVQVVGLTGVRAVSAGAYHSLAWKSGNDVWAWGDNAHGQVGNGESVINYLTPQQVIGLTGVAQGMGVTTGGDHCLILKSDGTIWTWGYNWAGQLGDGSTTNKSAAVQVLGLAGAIRVAGGGDFSLALQSDGTVWGWGYNGAGALGDGTTVNRSLPVQVKQ